MIKTKNIISPNIFLLLIYLTLISIIFFYNLLLPNPLVTIDGMNHYTFAKTDSGDYPPLISILTKPFAINPFTYWLFWFVIIFIAFPLMIVYLTKNKWGLFSGLLFSNYLINFDSFQAYAQFSLGLVIVFCIVSKSYTKKVLLLTFLALLYFLGLRIHQLELFILIWLFLVETILVLLKQIKFDTFWLSCGLIPDFIFNKQKSTITPLTDSVNVGVRDTFHNLVYYAYQFFWFHIPIWFILPAVKQALKKDRHLIYLLSFFIAIAGFVYLKGFIDNTFSRVLLFMPLFFMFPFLEWFSGLSFKWQRIFFSLGLFSFMLRFSWYLYGKAVGVGC